MLTNLLITGLARTYKIKDSLSREPKCKGAFLESIRYKMHKTSLPNTLKQSNQINLTSKKQEHNPSIIDHQLYC